MSINSSTTVLLPVSGIVTDAYKLLGAIDTNVPIAAGMMTDGIDRLNWMLKSSQLNGLNLHRRTQESLSIPGAVTGNASTAQGSNVLTNVDSNLIQAQVGQTVSGPNIPAGLMPPVTVQSVNVAASTITLSANGVATASASGQSFTAVSQQVNLSPNVLNVIDARWVQGGAPLPFERMLGPYQYAQYMSIPTKLSQSGAGPTVFMYDKQVNASALWLWQCPSNPGTLNVTASRIIADTLNVGDNIDMPQEATETVIYNLADRLIDVVGTAVSDPATAQRVSARAAALLQAWSDFDRPSSVFLKPWGRPGYGYSRARPRRAMR